MITAIVAKVEAETANEGVAAAQKELVLKAGKVELVGFRREVVAKLSLKADKTELEALARRSVVDQLSKELSENVAGDFGRSAAIEEIKAALGSKADTKRVRQLERRVNRRLKLLEATVWATREGLKVGATSSPPPSPPAPAAPPAAASPTPTKQ
jgi:16S rRNA C967 or C1407 C5-methylase (RsmB/RsmF family)